MINLASIKFKVALAVLGAVLLSGAVVAAYRLFKSNIELKAELERRDEAIKIYSESFERESEKLKELRRKLQQARNKEFGYAEIFSKHDLEKILEAKPNLLADRATRAYDRLFSAIEEATRTDSSASDDRASKAR